MNFSEIVAEFYILIYSVLMRSAWRPLKTVENSPLILADRRTIHKSDVIEIDRVMIDKVEKGLLVFHRPDQHWYYLSNQTPDELTIFTTWKSEAQETWMGEIPSDMDVISTDLRAEYSPHGASGCETDIRHPRESVEIRIAVSVARETCDSIDLQKRGRTQNNARDRTNFE
jgi:hypothetical protein